MVTSLYILSRFLTKRYYLTMSDSKSADKLWTVPNIISVSRLVIILPITIALLLGGHYVWCLVALTILGVTDWLDGFLARRLNQQSQFGKEMDPVADRVAVVFIGCAMIAAGLLPWPVVAVIAGTDIVVLTCTLFWFKGHAPNIPVSTVGKARTALLLFALPFLILAAAVAVPAMTTIGLVLVWTGAAGHVVAGVGYLRAMWLQYSQRKRVSAYEVETTGP